MDLEFLFKVRLFYPVFKNDPSHPPLASHPSTRGVARTFYISMWTSCFWSLQNGHALLVSVWGPPFSRGMARDYFHCRWPHKFKGNFHSKISLLLEGSLNPRCFQKGSWTSGWSSSTRGLGQRILSVVPNTRMSLTMCQAVLWAARILTDFNPHSSLMI